MPEFTDFYRGYAIHVQVFPTSDGKAEISCRITNPDVARITPLTAEVMRLPDGPFPAHMARDIGVAFGAGVIDRYLRESNTV